MCLINIIVYQSLCYIQTSTKVSETSSAWSPVDDCDESVTCWDSASLRNLLLFKCRQFPYRSFFMSAGALQLSNTKLTKWFLLIFICHKISKTSKQWRKKSSHSTEETNEPNTRGPTLKRLFTFNVRNQRETPPDEGRSQRKDLTAAAYS